MINLDGISAAQTKAMTNGGTNNAVIGNSLVKRGVMEKTENGEFRYMPTAEYTNFVDALAEQVKRDAAMEILDAEEEKRFAETMEREENETATSEDYEAKQYEREEQERKDAEIERLRAEFEEADDNRREEIRIALFHFGTVVYPVGSPQHEEYTKQLREALADPKAFDFLDTATSVTPDREQEFAAAVDADDAEAMREILNETAPPVVVRDPNATRYEDLAKWTDERLDTTEDALTRRLARRTIMGADRKLTESRLARVKSELAARGL